MAPVWYLGNVCLLVAKDEQIELFQKLKKAWVAVGILFYFGNIQLSLSTSF